MEKKLNIFQKIKKYFVIEPLLILWILPFCFNFVAIQNLGLEKACRVNLNYNEEVCQNMLDKSLNNIECDDLDTENITTVDISSFYNITPKSDDFNVVVCSAEIETQKLVTVSNGIRGPIASIFPIIVILFAGGWSDRHNLRKPCMLFPMIGETLASISMLISSIFFNFFPMEFSNILEKVFPSMFGGQTLMMMGIFSYLTATTEEKDRTFRFGIFGMCAGIIPLVGLPFSGALYKNLGYIKLFSMGVVLLILGILYLIYFVEEVKDKKDDTTTTAAVQQNGKGVDNPAFERDGNAANNHDPVKNKDLEQTVTKKKSCLLEFFDLTLAYDCIKVFLKKRENNGRLYLILLVFSYGLFMGPALAELDYLYQYIKLKLKWDDDEFSIFNTYSSAIILFGTFLMTSVFSKLLSMSDTMVGLVSAICTVISRPIYAFAKGYITYYVGQTVDMFVTPKTIAMKTIMSALVEQEELGRLYSILGIFEAIGGAIFPPIYSVVYSNTINTFPGAFYLFGEIFYIPNALLLCVCYCVLKPKPPAEDDDIALETKVVPTENKDQNYYCSDTMEASYL